MVNWVHGGNCTKHTKTLNYADTFGKCLETLEVNTLDNPPPPPPQMVPDKEHPLELWNQPTSKGMGPYRARGTNYHKGPSDKVVLNSYIRLL